MPLSPDAIDEFSAAAEAVEAATDVGASLRTRIHAVRVFGAALRTAERESFDRLMGGPVYHFVQQRTRYAAWAAEAKSILQSPAMRPRSGAIISI